MRTVGQPPSGGSDGSEPDPGSVGSGNGSSGGTPGREGSGNGAGAGTGPPGGGNGAGSVPPVPPIGPEPTGPDPTGPELTGPAPTGGPAGVVPVEPLPAVPPAAGGLRRERDGAVGPTCGFGVAPPGRAGVVLPPATAPAAAQVRGKGPSAS
jgi:hypothetical protein